MDAMEAAVQRAASHLHSTQRDDPDLWSSNSRVNRLWIEYYMAVYREAGMEADPEMLEACAAEVYRQFLAPGAWKLYPDVLPILRHLHEQGYTIGVVSDWESALVGTVLLPLGVGPYIDFMVVSTVMREAKPGSGLYREALARAGVASHEAVHVGDNYITDVLGARSAGIEGILLDRDDKYREATLDCTCVASLMELPGVIRNE